METKRVKKLPHNKDFRVKLLRSLMFAGSIISFSLLLGIFGYMYFFNLSFVDSLYNASMILTGMGPVDAPPGNAGKIFGSFYALYSGVAFLGSVAVIFSPLIHRFLHKFHLDIEE